MSVPSPHPGGRADSRRPTTASHPRLLAGIDDDGSNEGHAAADLLADRIGVGDAAGQQDGVHLAADAGRRLADELGHVQGHGVVDQLGVRVAVLDAVLHLAAVGGAEVGQQAAPALPSPASSCSCRTDPPRSCGGSRRTWADRRHARERTGPRR